MLARQPEAMQLRYLQTLGNIATNARMQDFGQQRNLYEQDINRRSGMAWQAPQMANQRFDDAQKLYDIGQTQRYDQFNPLGKFGSLISGNYGSVSQSPIYQNKGADLLGGGLLGLQAYNQFGGNKG